VRAALRTNMELAQVGYRSWFSYVHRLLVFLDLEHLIYTSDLKEINYQLSRLKSRLHMMADNLWEAKRTELITSSSKLDFYTSIKTKCGIAPYLVACSNLKARNAITKMRISAQKLPVETVRYAKEFSERTDKQTLHCLNWLDYLVLS